MCNRILRIAASTLTTAAVVSSSLLVGASPANADEIVEPVPDFVRSTCGTLDGLEDAEMYAGGVGLAAEVYGWAKWGTLGLAAGGVQVFDWYACDFVPWVYSWSAA